MRLNPQGEWNSSRIVFDNGHVEHWLNGVKILEFEAWTDDWFARKHSGKWETAPEYGLARRGVICLQDHGSPASFRNLKIKELTGEVMAFQEDSFRNLTSIKAFSITDYFEREMYRLQQDYSGAFLSYNGFQIRMTTFLSLLSMAVTGVCFGWGVYQLWNGSITYGSLTLFLQLATTLRGAFSSLLSLAQQAISITTSAGRIIAVESLPEENQEVPEGLSQETSLDIQIEQASFHYQNGEGVLDTFDLPPATAT